METEASFRPKVGHHVLGDPEKVPKLLGALSFLLCKMEMVSRPGA